MPCIHDGKNFYRACVNAIYDDIVWMGKQFTRANNSASSIWVGMKRKL